MGALVRSLVMTRFLVMQDGPAALPRVRGLRVEARSEVAIDWLTQFYRGERQIIEQVYRSNFAAVDGAVGAVMSGADRETATHEIFFRVINNETLRRSFKGGDLGAWLAVVARNHAIDYVRRRGREAPSGIDLPDGAAGYSPDLGRQSEARLLVERFAREVLPAEWRPVFEKRLLQSFSQAEAAAALGLSRTTLAYRELRIRLLLRKFLLGDAS